MKCPNCQKTTNDRTFVPVINKCFDCINDENILELLSMLIIEAECEVSASTIFVPFDWVQTFCEIIVLELDEEIPTTVKVGGIEFNLEECCNLDEHDIEILNDIYKNT